MTKHENTLPASGELVIYQSEDGRIRLETRLENETLWLTQQQMADLFQTSQQNISLHVQNIYEEGELTPEATHKKNLLVRQEGTRQVRREHKESIGETDSIKQLEAAAKQITSSDDGTEK